MTSNIFECVCFPTDPRAGPGIPPGIPRSRPKQRQFDDGSWKAKFGEGPNSFNFFWWAILNGVKRNYTLIFLMFILDSLLRSLIFERDPRIKIGIELYRRKSRIFSQRQSPHDCWDWNPEGIGENDWHLEICLGWNNNLQKTRQTLTEMWVSKQQMKFLERGQLFCFLVRLNRPVELQKKIGEEAVRLHWVAEEADVAIYCIMICLFMYGLTFKHPAWGPVVWVYVGDWAGGIRHNKGTSWFEASVKKRCPLQISAKHSLDMCLSVCLLFLLQAQVNDLYCNSKHVFLEGHR